MAAGQLSDVGGFERILVSYRVFGGAEAVVAWAVPAAEAAVAALLLVRRRLPHRVRRAAGAGGIAVALFWTALATQAFARSLELENCGCFGVHLAQSLRWWILVEDAEFILLAILAGRAAGLRVPRLRRSRRAAGQERRRRSPPSTRSRPTPVI